MKKKRFSLEHRKKLSKAQKLGILDKIKNNKKLCPKCEKLLKLSHFHKAKKRPNGHQLWCTTCGYKEHMKRYYKYRRNQELLESKDRDLKKKYKITLNDYNIILKKQKGVCWICKKVETQKSNPKGRTDRLRVDHNHKTGKIRGLLCSKCNFGIAQFNEDIVILKRAIKYLKEKNNV